MRVICHHCKSKATITSNNELSETVKDLYCQCNNTQSCGASFVITMAFKHDLNPPQQTTLQIAAALINKLDDADKKQLMQGDLFT